MRNKYLAVFNLSAQQTLRNYKALIGLSLFMITCLVIFAHLWKVAATKMGVTILNPDRLLWYIAFNEWVLISIPDVQENMEQDLRSGKLAYLLPRPISYLNQVFFEGLGVLSVQLLVLGIIAFVFTRIQIGHAPLSYLAFPAAVLLGVIAGAVGLIFQMVIGVTAFWLHEVGPFNWIWEKLLFLLGGLFLPLSVYPGWLQQVARFTPFSALLGDRSALALQFSWTQVFTLTASLLGWTVLGIILLIFLYRKGLKVLNIEGG